MHLDVIDIVARVAVQLDVRWLWELVGIGICTILCLRQDRLAGGDIMISGCSFVHSFVCSSVHLLLGVALWHEPSVCVVYLSVCL